MNDRLNNCIWISEMVLKYLLFYTKLSESYARKYFISVDLII